ncbi:MAG: M48 family metalloprotease [Desulfobacterales bacterium]|nr:M48 family metalloprotease [Desulfobacterales bacterium]
MKKKCIKISFLGFSLIGRICWIPSCAVNPVSGKQELMLLSESSEIDLGRQTDAEVVKEYGVLEDPKLTAYLNDFCQRLGKVSHRPQLSYRFKIVDASVVNAFAVPGGYVYFSRGILATLNNEAELAGVMGHEVGHIAARHSAKQYSRAQLAQVGLGVGAVFIDSPALSGLVQLGAGMLFLRFSRDNEREADDLGVEYASKAGYDAAQLASFFETLERMNPGSDRSGLPGWFSTHPSPQDRVQVVRARAKEWQERLGLRDSKVNREPYLRRIDGLLFGDDPGQGYVDGNIFYHPGLRFQFPVPTKWKLNHKPSQVQMVSEEEDAVILLSATSGSSSREAAREFVTKTGAAVIRSDGIQVNGLSTQRVTSEIRTEKADYRLMSYFIEKGKSVFVFHGLTSVERFQSYGPLFENTMRQFRELSDPRRIDVKPDRIRIRATRSSDTLENALRSLNVPNEKLKEVALLNGGNLNQIIPANTLIKVVEKGS